MDLFKLLFTFYSLALISVTMGTTKWRAFVTSSNYENTKLITETVNPFRLLNFTKEIGALSARITCSTLCGYNSSCLGFNFYPTSTHYVCEFLIENFCSSRQRIVLQVWPGGKVWDKVLPGTQKSCIDQRFENKPSATSYCDIGRFGCRNGSNNLQTWPGCNNCFRTCADCYNYYNPGTYHNCTLWPEGPSQAPIFSFCSTNGTFMFLRGINSLTGQVYRNDVMSLRDIYRLSRLRVYKVITIYFEYASSYYEANYENFHVDENGTLMNLTLAPGQTDDGFNVGSQPLKPSPWVESDSACGSFWLLNSTQTSSTLQCPGGGVGMFGKVNIASLQTGIRWPKATAQGKVMYFTSLRFKK